MSFNTTSMLRALSPLSRSHFFQHAGEASGAADGEFPPVNEVDHLMQARHMAMQAASTVDEVIAMVPSDYRHVLAEPLKGVASTATKLLNARATLAKWEAHKAAGTFPPHIVVKLPAVQTTRGFRESAEGLACRANFTQKHDAYLGACLNDSISTKRDEVSFLQRALLPETLFKELQHLVVARHVELKMVSKIPEFSLDGGELILTGWKENEATNKLSMEMLTDLVVYCHRIISLVEARESIEASKKAKKVAVAKAADAEMADLTRPGPSIQSLVDKAVSAAVKKSASVSPKKRPQTRSQTKKRRLETPPPYVPPPAKKARAKAKSAYATPAVKAANAAAKKAKKDKGKGKARE
ncbi:hypothetical protein F5I97DRAFT_1927528 [Phlebopus sp. FC_14]|nr:hypothetical protein F5I97DRAFT_1932047 [Phlebopus sp. FC_14]KAH7884215.1 hypothetical protein F5I97DRAFT_1930429 [Phlebopus sp. FC_14]KAH7885660.1 hypothetical protein F5I97DRAFT_1927528 [Phlebopus sp. FC_14]